MNRSFSFTPRQQRTDAWPLRHLPQIRQRSLHLDLRGTTTEWSSIQNEDSLDTAVSLYMAETLLRVVEQPAGAVFLIDEMFRGTNNLESVSTAAAVLSHLADRALGLVSSHNLVLAPLLQSRLDALRIIRSSDSAGALLIEDGVLVETNGIQMMEYYAIPDQVRANAKRVHG